MWCNQIFSLIQPRVAITEGEEEFAAMVEDYMVDHTDASLEVAQAAVLDSLETVSRNVVMDVLVCDSYTVANELATAQYGADAFAVDTTNVAVVPGFTYSGGVFFNYENDPVEPIPTERERIDALTGENAALKEQLILLEECIMELSM